MRIIVNADDFGWSKDTAKATIECLEAGTVTSATLMANMPATEAALRFALANPRFSYGAHLTLCGSGEERPISSPRDIPGLVDRNGAFRPGRVVLVALMAGRIPADQIMMEVTAQLEVFRASGVMLSHVDSHGHLHKSAAVMSVLRSVLPTFGITRMRRGQNVWLRRPYLSPTYWVGAVWHPSVDRWFRTSGAFVIPTCEEDRARLPRALEHIQAESLEIGCHPGFEEDWRNQERRMVQDIAELVGKQSETELIGWNRV